MIYLSLGKRIKKGSHMINRPLSPVLSEAITSDIDASVIKFLLVSHADTLGDYLYNKAIKVLLSQHKLLIITDDTQKQEELRQLFSKHNMTHLHSPWSKEQLTENRVERIRQLATLSQVENTPQDVKRIIAYEHLLKAELREIDQQRFNLPLAIGQSVTELILSHGAQRTHVDNSYSLSRDFSINNTHADLLSNIEELQSMYRQRYYYQIHESIIAQSVYNTYDTYATSVEHSMWLHQQCDALVQELSEIKENLLSGITRQIHHDVKLWQEIYSTIEEVYTSHESNGRVSIDSQIAKCMVKAEQAVYLNLPDELYQNYSVEYIPMLIQAIKELTATSNQVREQESQSYWQRLTPFNTKNEQLTRLQASISALYKEIDTTEWLMINTYEQAMTLPHIELHLELTFIQLGRCIALLSDHDYTQFRRLAAEINIPDSVLHRLIQLDKDVSWQEHIQSCLIDEYIQLETGKRINTINKRLSQLHHITPKWAHKTIHNHLANERNTAIEALMEVQPLPINLLIKKLLTDTSIDELLHAHTTLTQALLPIMSANGSEVTSIDTSLWQEVIFYDVKSVDADLIKLLLAAECKITIATSHPVHLNEIQRQWPTSLFFAHQPPIIHDTLLSQLSLTERYKHARTLAAAVQTCHKSCNIYRIREKCIISLLNEDMNDHILREAGESDLNTLHLNTDRIEDMTEAMIMPDTDVYVLHSENTLSGRTNHLLWEEYVMTQLEAAGIKLISVSTERLMKNYSNAMRKITQTLTEYTSAL